MLRWNGLLCLAVGLGCSVLQAAGQAAPTAVQQSQLSVFGGLTGEYTGLQGGRNLGLTAGVDYSLPGYVRFHPSIELRGTYPIEEGRTVREKDGLIGLRVSHLVGPFNVYGDFLYGRGEIKYISTFDIGQLQFLKSYTNVYSPGLGAEYQLTHHFGLRADAQFQRWSTPAIPAGSAWAEDLTGAVTYTFDFNHHYRRR